MPSLVRPAAPPDLARCLELAAAMHAEAPAYRAHPFDGARVARLLGDLCRGAIAGWVFFVVEVAGEVVGGLFGGLMPAWYSGEVQAVEVALFVAPAHRTGWAALRLVRAFVEWARRAGAVRVMGGASTGVRPAGTARLYAHLGFEPVGPSLALELGGGGGGGTEGEAEAP